MMREREGRAVVPSILLSLTYFTHTPFPRRRQRENNGVCIRSER